MGTAWDLGITRWLTADHRQEEGKTTIVKSFALSAFSEDIYVSAR